MPHGEDIFLSQMIDRGTHRVWGRYLVAISPLPGTAWTRSVQSCPAAGHRLVARSEMTCLSAVCHRCTPTQTSVQTLQEGRNVVIIDVNVSVCVCLSVCVW